MATRMQQRRGTAAQWTSANPVLAAGEIGFETDTNKFKVGNGSTAWASLTYFVDGSIAFDSAEVTAAINTAIDAVIDAAPNTLNTLNELAAAINDDATFGASIVNNFASINNQFATQANLNANVSSDISAINATLTNAVSDISGLTSTTGNIIANLDTHANAATNVHGIADVANLAIKANVTAEIEDAIETLGNAVTTQIANAIGDHNNVTTNAHGISNTLALVFTSDSRLSDERVPTDGSVAEGKIASGAVTNAKIGADAVDGTKIADDSIAAEHIADEAITNAHISNTAAIAQSKVSGLTTDLGNKQDKVSGVSDTEIGYLDGVTSNIQAQIDGKAALAGASFTGNISTTGDLTVDGNFIVNGSNVLVSATQIQIEDTLLQLGHTNANNISDLGLVASYNDGTQKHSGLVKDVTDGKWKLFDGVTTEPGTTVDFTQGNLDTLAVGALEAANVITATSGVAFSDGTQTKEAVPSRTAITSVTGAYNLSTGGLALRDGLIEANSSSAFTITIPTNSTTQYPVGTSIDVLQVGSGQITIAGDTGVTVNATPGLKLRTQWSSATLFKRAENSWVVYGDLAL
jgi:hypothetical protein